MQVSHLLQRHPSAGKTFTKRCAEPRPVVTADRLVSQSTNRVGSLYYICMYYRRISAVFCNGVASISAVEHSELAHFHFRFIFQSSYDIESKAGKYTCKFLTYNLMNARRFDLLIKFYVYN